MSVLDTVAGWFGRAPLPTEAPAAESGDLLGQLPLWGQYSRIGGSLTPGDVSSILYQADAGDGSRLVDLANDSRQKDGHYQKVLSDREQGVTLLDYSVSPFIERGERAASEASSEVAGFVEEAIAGAKGCDQTVRSFADMVAHMQGATHHGHATAQTVWRRDGRYLMPIGFVLSDQRRFRFRRSDGLLVWQDRVGMGEAVDLQDAYPGSFIVHQPRINGDVKAREGLSRLFVWCALFRNWATADWLRLAELAWKPLRRATYSGKATADQRNSLRAALARFVATGALVHNEKNQVFVEWARNPPGAGGQSAHAEICEFFGAEMSKAALHGTLTTEAGNRGARALGDVHAEGQKAVRESDARQTAQTLERDLVRWIVAVNFGTSAPMPRTCFDTAEAVELAGFAKGIADLRSAKVPIAVRWVHDHIGHPTPDEDDEMLGDDDEDVDLSELDENPPPAPPAADEEADDGDEKE